MLLAVQPDAQLVIPAKLAVTRLLIEHPVKLFDHARGVAHRGHLPEWTYPSKLAGSEVALRMIWSPGWMWSSQRSQNPCRTASNGSPTVPAWSWSAPPRCFGQAHMSGGSQVRSHSSTAITVSGSRGCEQGRGRCRRFVSTRRGRASGSRPAPASPSASRRRRLQLSHSWTRGGVVRGGGRCRRGCGGVGRAADWRDAAAGPLRGGSRRVPVEGGEVFPAFRTAFAEVA